MEKIKIGLIGFGSWAKSAYLPALHYDGRAEIIAVTAASENTRRLALKTLGDHVAVFSSYRELLEQAKPDAVMIAVPDALHQEALSAALEADAAVFYEPPVSHMRRQIPMMIDKLLAAKQVSFAHLELSYHPALSRARELIGHGWVGLLHSITITLHAGFHSKENYDLCLTDRMSCWYIDVLNKLAGSLPSRVLTLDGSGTPGRMQSVSMGIYDYNGFWGIFKADQNRPGELSITVEIDGSHGGIFIDYFNGIMSLRTDSNPQPHTEELFPQKPYADYPGVREAVSAFLDAVSSGNVQKGNAEQVAVLNLIGLAADESKDSGTWAEVKYRS